MARSISREKKRRQDRLGQMIMAAVLLLVAGAFFGYRAITGNAVSIDRATLCPLEGPQSLTVVLIDRTDALGVVQQAALRRDLEKVRDAVPRYGALKVFAVGPIGDSLLQPIVEVCNPGRGSEISELTGNPRLVEKRWREGFAGPVEELIESLADVGEAASSPILESIQSVAVTTLSAAADDLPKRLVIASDMLQHSDALSHYRNALSFDAFKQSPHYQRLRSDLRGVEVEILYLRRETRKTSQGKAHIQFWSDWLVDQGAAQLRVVSVEG